MFHVEQRLITAQLLAMMRVTPGLMTPYLKRPPIVFHVKPASTLLLPVRQPTPFASRTCGRSA
ncbi:MAG: hypothetical protein QOD31_1941, partial [Pseudonocardiales bacterium]|nr:hypothetical protein [Pseudonocardiales bacterium]